MLVCLFASIIFLMDKNISFSFNLIKVVSFSILFLFSDKLWATKDKYKTKISIKICNFLIISFYFQSSVLFSFQFPNRFTCTNYPQLKSDFQLKKSKQMPSKKNKIVAQNESICTTMLTLIMVSGTWQQNV